MGVVVPIQARPEAKRFGTSFAFLHALKEVLSILSFELDSQPDVRWGLYLLGGTRIPRFKPKTNPVTFEE